MLALWHSYCTVLSTNFGSRNNDMFNISCCSFVLTKNYIEHFHADTVVLVRSDCTNTHLRATCSFEGEDVGDTIKQELCRVFPRLGTRELDMGTLREVHNTRMVRHVDNVGRVDLITCKAGEGGFGSVHTAKRDFAQNKKSGVHARTPNDDNR